VITEPFRPPVVAVVSDSFTGFDIRPPVMATTLRSSSPERITQSIAFFKTPGRLKRYAGEAMKTGSLAASTCLHRRTLSGTALASVSGLKCGRSRMTGAVVVDTSTDDLTRQTEHDVRARPGPEVGRRPQGLHRCPAGQHRARTHRDRTTRRNKPAVRSGEPIRWRSPLRKQLYESRQTGAPARRPSCRGSLRVLAFRPREWFRRRARTSC
jgi:hypothetical protein